MERIAIYIDGANFYYGVRSIKRKYSDFRFDFDKYVKAGLPKGRKLVRVYYYNASLKKQIDEQIYREQQHFFSRLRNVGFVVRLFRRQKRESTEGKSYYTIKGDDIHLAIDMLKGAYENEYDTAILVSGDGDFCPLVRYVKQKSKKVEVCYFPDLMSLALMRVCDVSYPITKKIVNKFFYRS